LIPGTSHEQVVRGFKFLWAKSESPNWTLALIDGEELSTSLVFDQDCTVEEADGEQLAIWRPVAGNTPCWSLGLVDALAIRHPKTEVNARAGCERLKHWVEAQGLDLVVVGVFQQTLPFCRPNDDSIVGSAGREPLPILRVSDAEDGIFVTFDFVQELSSLSLVDEDEVGNTDENLLTVGSKTYCPDLICLIGLWWRHWNGFLPLYERAHII